MSAGRGLPLILIASILVLPASPRGRSIESSAAHRDLFNVFQPERSMSLVPAGRQARTKLSQITPSNTRLATGLNEADHEIFEESEPGPVLVSSALISSPPIVLTSCRLPRTSSRRLFIPPSPVRRLEAHCTLPARVAVLPAHCRPPPARALLCGELAGGI